MAFYNVPQIEANNYYGFPLSLVTASIDHRTGHYISDILKNFIDSE